MDTKLESSAAVLDTQKDVDGSFPTDKKITVVFVLGGPGSGKGTQCANIVEHFGFTHLSTGDLLRAESKSGSPNGIMIRDMMNEGKIVPSEVTIKLLRKAMLESGNDKFLIDGFPRNEENRAAFENIMKIEPEFVLYFDCPVEELERRLLNRNQGRDDDNIGTIQKRFKVFIESTLPILEYYNSKGKLRKVDAGKPVDEVFEDVKAILSPLAVEADTCSKSNASMVLRLESLIFLIKRLFRAARMLLIHIFHGYTYGVDKLIFEPIYNSRGTALEEGRHASLIQK